MYGDSDFGLSVNSKSQNQDAAKTFVTWMTTTEKGQQLIANILNQAPALNGVAPNWSEVKLVKPDAQQPNLQELIKTTSTVAEPRLSLVSSELQEAVGVAATTVAAGQASPEQAAKKLQETMAAAG
jgi:ABC-type glycerol-3-phosphate transport system substrate-binding protein